MLFMGIAKMVSVHEKESNEEPCKIDTSPNMKNLIKAIDDFLREKLGDLSTVSINVLNDPIVAQGLLEIMSKHELVKNDYMPYEFYDAKTYTRNLIVNGPHDLYGLMVLGWNGGQSR